MPETADNQDAQTALTEALKIIEEGLEDGDNASADDMRAALGELEDHFGENPDMFDSILKGNVSVFRNELNAILEGTEDKESLKRMLEEVRNQLKDVFNHESAEDDAKEGGDEKAKQAIESKLGNLMNVILEENSLFKPDADPASMALVKMFLDEGLDQSDLDRLQTFLQKPNAFLPAEAAMHKNKSADELKTLIADAESDIQDVIDQISDNKERSKYENLSKNTRTTYSKEYADLLCKKRAKKKEKTALEFALEFNGGTMRYKSVEQVMYMSRLWLGNDRKEDMPSELNIMKEMESKIDAKRSDRKENWGILKPRLTLILETIAEKNAHLNKIDTDKLKELAKCWDDKNKVEVWLDSVEGTDEYKMTKIAPPLIAYLQIAVRDGLASNIPVISGKHAEGLLKHLKTIRHEKAKKLVSEKLGENKTGVDAMTAYFAEIAKMTANEQEITKEHISRSPYWKLSGKGVKLGAKGIYYGGKGIAGGLLRLTKFGGRSVKKTSEWVQGMSDDTKQGITRGALRGMCAGVVGAGVAVAGLAAAPVAALIAMPAVFTPEFIKHREAIAKGGAKTLNAGGRTALFAGKLGLLGLTGGLAVFSSRWRDSVRFKNF